MPTSILYWWNPWEGVSKNSEQIWGWRSIWTPPLKNSEQIWRWTVIWTPPLENSEQIWRWTVIWTRLTKAQTETVPYPALPAVRNKNAGSGGRRRELRGRSGRIVVR